MPSKPLSDRFYEKVQVKAPNECWPWTGYRTKNGYGTIWTVEARRSVYAHRASYELHIGPIPDGMSVCHRCDNPPCVNPAHLFLGTQPDNIADMHHKGRYRRPTEPVRSRAKLTAHDVLNMRSAFARGVGRAELARTYGVSRKQVNKIVGGQAWHGLQPTRTTEDAADAGPKPTTSGSS